MLFARARRTGIAGTYGSLMCLLATMLILSMFSGAAVAGNTFVANASIDVVCPFLITANTLPTIYLIPANVNIFYAMRTTAQCSIQNPTGYIQITNPTAAAYNESVTEPNIITSNTYYNRHVNSSLLQDGSHIADVNFSTFMFSNSTTFHFETIMPATLTITNASLSSTSVNIGSEISLSEYINDIGDLVANQISLHIKISGPNSYIEAYTYNFLPISAGNKLFLQISPNATNPNVGDYQLSENVSYMSTYYANISTYTTNTIRLNYSATNSSSGGAPPNTGGGGGGGPSGGTGTIPLPIATVGPIGLTTSPFLITVPQGVFGSSEFGLKNTGDSNATILLHAPSFPGLNISLSATTLFIAPSQEQLVKISFNPNATENPGTYLIPINITAIVNGVRYEKTLYTDIIVKNSNSSQNLVSSIIFLQNQSQELVDELSVLNPTDKIIYNSTLSIMLPLSAASSISKITLAGAPGNVTIENNMYIITWTISKLLPHVYTTVYYSMASPKNPSILLNSPIILSTSQASSQSGNLRIFNINIPSLFVNATGIVQITGLYAGAIPTNISFALISKPGINIANSTKAYGVYPNSELTAKFFITATEPGIYPITLYIYGKGINTTYNLVANVAPVQMAASAIAASTQNYPLQLSQQQIYLTLGLMTCLVITYVALRFGRPKLMQLRYDKKKVNKLKSIKRIMERGE